MNNIVNHSQLDLLDQYQTKRHFVTFTYGTASNEKYSPWSVYPDNAIMIKNTVVTISHVHIIYRH